MSDYGHEETDKMLAKLERKIKTEYRRAYNELSAKVDAYFEQFARLDKEKQKKVKEGKISQEEYVEWRKNKMLTGQRWDEMRDTVAYDLTKANEIAAGLIANNNVDVYALNANYALYEVENGIHGGISLTLYDRKTVEKLFKENGWFIPKVDLPKDQLWNKRKITSAILQGILQGEDIKKITQRLISVTDMSTSAAIRNARTYTTSAENGGRQDRYKEVEEMGIHLQKEWLATMDNRTRHEHRLLDGQRREVDEPFEVENEKIMYPADPTAAGHLIYNCRCTMKSVVMKYDKGIKRYDLPEMTYEEWKEAKPVYKKKKKDKKKKKAKE